MFLLKQMPSDNVHADTKYYPEGQKGLKKTKPAGVYTALALYTAKIQYGPKNGHEYFLIVRPLVCSACSCLRF